MKILNFYVYKKIKKGSDIMKLYRVVDAQVGIKTNWLSSFKEAEKEVLALKEYISSLEDCVLGSKIYIESVEITADISDILSESAFNVVEYELIYSFDFGDSKKMVDSENISKLKIEELEDANNINYIWKRKNVVDSWFS